MNDLRIYVISLAKNNPRRARLADAMAPLGRPYEVFDAVDGRDGLDPSLEPELDRMATARTMRNHISDGEFACALSHRNVQARFLDSGSEWALVLEDDVILDARVGRLLADGGYRTAPMLLLYHANAWVRGKGVPIAGTESCAIAVAPWMSRSIRKPIAGENPAAPLAFLPYGAAGYTMNRSVARRLVEAQSPIRAVADWPIDLASVGAHALVPGIVSHPSYDSVPSALVPIRTTPAPLMSLAKKIWIRAYWRRKWSKLRGARRVS